MLSATRIFQRTTSSLARQLQHHTTFATATPAMTMAETVATSNTSSCHNSITAGTFLWAKSSPSVSASLWWSALYSSSPSVSMVLPSLFNHMAEGVWNMSSTLKKRRAKMNKHKLKKRRKKMRLKSK